MAVIGTLTVNLEANTATFSGDLGKAAKSAEDFGSAASAAGKQVDYSMMEAKGSMMLLSEQLGVHIPRHLQTLIAEIPAVGAAFGAMLPLVGAVAAIAIIAKLVEKNEEAKEKFTHDWMSANTEVQEVFNKLSDKLLDAGIKADELSGNHLGALTKQLQKIDNMSMRELVTEMGTVQKAADRVFEDLKSHWYEFGGSEEAKKKLDDITDKYQALLAVKDKAGAADFLAKRLKEETAEMETLKTLNVGGVTTSEKKLKSQDELLTRLKDYVTLQTQSAQLAKADTGNVNKGEENNARKEFIDNLQEQAKKRIELSKAIAKAEGEEIKEAIAAAEHEKKAIDAVLDSKQKEADVWVKITEKMIQEDTRHAQAMADLEAKDGGASKKGEEKRYNDLKAALAKERTLIVSSGEQRVADEQKLDHKEEEEKQKHENKMTELTRKSEQTRADLAKQFAHLALFEHQNMAAALEQMGKKELSDLVDNTLQALIVQKDAAAQERLIDAKSSAVSAYKSVYASGIPWPFNSVLAPIAAGAAFAGVLAFEHGGDIPGTGPQHIIGHGGETVVTRALTDRVKESEGRGGRRQATVVFNISTPSPDAFRASQSQIIAKQTHAQDKAKMRDR
jgi:hypothetical protein